MAYDDTILIKLRRDYSHDEVVMYALNTIKDLRIENGKLNSYIEELKHNHINSELVNKNSDLLAEVLTVKTELRKLKEKPKSRELTLISKIEDYKKKSLKKDINLEKQRIRLGELKKENSRLTADLKLCVLNR